MNLLDAVIIPLILGLVEIAKRAGLPTSLAPLASLALGVAAGIVYLAPDDVPQAVLLGIVAGLGASGLWSGGKAAVESVRGDPPDPLIGPGL